MFCSNCGKQIFDNSKFCKYCGYSMETDTNTSEKFSPFTKRMFTKTTNNNTTKNMSLLVILLLIAFVICNFAPIVKTKSYVGQKDYNIISFTKDILYGEYSFSFYGEWYRGEDFYTWPASGGTVSVFEYMHGKSAHVGDQSYDSDMADLAWLMYIVSLFTIVINIFLVGLIIIKLVNKQFFSIRLLNIVFCLEIMRLGVLFFDIHSIIEMVPEVFKHKDSYVGGYEVATATMYPFYLVTIILLFILQIIYYIYFRNVHDNLGEELV